MVWLPLYCGHRKMTHNETKPKAAFREKVYGLNVSQLGVPVITGL